MVRNIGKTGQARLNRFSPTMAESWIVRRRGQPLAQGFRCTTHQIPLQPSAVAFKSDAGLRVANARKEVGTREGDTSITLSTEPGRGLDFDDVNRGLYIDGKARLMMLDWSIPWLPSGIAKSDYIIDSQTITDMSVTFNLRGLLSSIDRHRQEYVSQLCQNTLGKIDPLKRQFCPVQLAQFPNTVTNCTVIGVRAASTGLARTEFDIRLPRFEADRHDPDGAFKQGRTIFQTGLNANSQTNIHTSSYLDNTGVTLDLTIELVEPMYYDIRVGDTLLVSLGCDRFRTTCRDDFNVLPFGFRGTPDIPGFDGAIANPLAN